MSDAEDPPARDPFTLSRLRKLGALLAQLKPRDSSVTKPFPPGSRLVQLFRLMDERTDPVVQLLSKYARAHLQRGAGWISISVQGEDNTWWSSYVICLRRVANGDDPRLTMTLTEPNAADGTPSSVTLEVAEADGALEFAAWTRLDFVCQSVVRLSLRYKKQRETE